MEYDHIIPLDKSNSDKWIVPNVRNKITRWINDSNSKSTFEFYNKTIMPSWGSNFGHFSNPVDPKYYFAGARIWIDNKQYVIQKIMGDGTQYGSVILNGNPPMGFINKIETLEFTDSGLQHIFADDSIYNPNIHGDICWYQAFGFDGLFIGDYTVKTKNYQVNDYTMLLCPNWNDIVGSTSLEYYTPDTYIVTVEDASIFKLNQEILFHQTQCYEDINRAGTYAYNFIDEIYLNTNQIKLRYPLGEFFITTRWNVCDCSVCQIVTVPHFKNLIIDYDCSITCPKWNGKYGGIIVFRVAETFINNGNINVTGCGFRGGKDTYKTWWYCLGGKQSHATQSRLEPNGGEGLFGPDYDWGVNQIVTPNYNFGDHYHYGTRLYPKDDINYKEPPCYPWGDIEEELRSTNHYTYAGGGGFNVMQQDCYGTQSRVTRGMVGGGGGGSYTPGGSGKGVSYKICGETRGDCENRYKDAFCDGGDAIEKDRSLSLNMGCGGASGRTFHPNIGWLTGAGGNGGGIILVTARVIINNGYISSNGEGGELNYYKPIYGYCGSVLDYEKYKSAATGGGGGAGTICLMTQRIINKATISLRGGTGYNLIDSYNCIGCSSGLRAERHQFWSGKGGDGHLVYTSLLYPPIFGKACFAGKIEEVNRLWDFRLAGFFGYDYRLMWSKNSQVYNTPKGYFNITKVWRLQNWIVDYDDRQLVYKSRPEYRFGFIKDGKLMLYDFIRRKWKLSQVCPVGNACYEDYRLLNDTDTQNYNLQDKMDSSRYLTSDCITNITKTVGAFFSYRSFHHLYTPLLTQVKFNVIVRPYNIWYKTKIRIVNTTPSNLVYKILNM